MEPTEGHNLGGNTTRCKRRERVVSPDPELDCKRVRIDSPESDRPVVTKADESDSEDIVKVLGIMEDEIDIGPDIQGLESLIRSLEEEINPPAPAPTPAKEMDETVVLIEDGDQLDLGYLLEASDGEVGLPLTTSSGNGARAEIDSSMAKLAGVIASDDEISGLDNSIQQENAGGESHAGALLTSLFDCGGCDASEVPELQRLPESMPAL